MQSRRTSQRQVGMASVYLNNKLLGIFIYEVIPYTTIRIHFNWNLKTTIAFTSQKDKLSKEYYKRYFHKYPVFLLTQITSKNVIVPIAMAILERNLRYLYNLINNG